MKPLRVLILGGTSEATALAGMLAQDQRFEPVLSLAGVTARPAPSPVTRRIGGFGGADGLARYLVTEQFGAVVDATHPFARRITENAGEAAAAVGVGLLRLCRPEWPRRRDWEPVGSADAAVQALGVVPGRVLLTVGRGELAPFLAAKVAHRWWVRSIDPPGPVPHGAEVILARPPFSLENEIALMRDHAITHLVTKNSGGDAVAAKLDAADRLAVRVVMIARPPEAVGDDRVEGALAAMRWLEGRM